MDALLELLSEIPFRPLGTVVHLGAGGTDPALHEAMQARRLILVDGNPAAVAELRLLSAKGVTRLNVIQAVVAAQASTVTWNHYNLPWLDGTSDASNLSNFYPRLERTGSEPRQAIALSDFLRELHIDEADGSFVESNVLMIDLPGQDRSLLEALPPELLASFGWIAVRGRADSDHVVETIRSLLGAGFYDLVSGTEPLDAIWPTALFKRSLRRLESALREQLDTLERQVTTLTHGAQAATADYQRVLSISEARAAEIDVVKKEQDALDVERQALRRIVEDLTNELGATKRDLDDVVARQGPLQSELSARQAELDALRRMTTDLRSDQVRMSTTLEESQGAFKAASARLATAEATTADLRVETDRLNKALQDANGERKTLCAQQEDLNTQLSNARSEIEALRTARSDGEVRQRMLDAEILRAEAQLELVKDVLLREKNF